jgi:hypothetical protein
MLLGDSFIRQSGLNHKPFTTFLDEVESKYVMYVTVKFVCLFSMCKVLQQLL